MREHSYLAQPSLLQLCQDDGRTTLIDICRLSPSNIRALWQFFSDPQRTFIAHSASQDWDLLTQLCQRAPDQHWYDTQIAWSLCHTRGQIGYADMVEQLLNISLDKQATRSNWLARPLSPMQINYAAEDVHHLAACWGQLSEQLKELDRHDWLEQECRSTYQSLPDSAPIAWRKISPLHQLNDEALSRGQRLATFREQIARQDNIPRKWLFDDQALILMAKLGKPPDYLPRLQKYQQHIIGAQHLDALHAVLAEPMLQPPERVRARRTSTEQKSLLAACRTAVNEQATALNIDPQRLSNRDDHYDWLMRRPECRFHHGWRHQVLGPTLAKIDPSRQRDAVHEP